LVELAKFNGIEKIMKLNKLSLAYTLAIFYGVGAFLMMAYSLLTGKASDFMARAAVLHWASYSWGGAILVLIEETICGFIVGWLFAWVYNKLAKD
jgi:hypothetical protein